MNDKATILIVDDGPVQLKRTQLILKNAGFSVVTARDGVEAMNYLNSESPLPDLILTDILMPNMDGFELCTKVKDSFKDIPVIIVTSYNDEEKLKKAFDAGAVDYLGIPFSKIELLVRINNTLKTQNAIMKEVKAKRKFMECEEQYATLIRTIPDIIYKVDANGKFTFLSDSIEQLGYSPKELIGRHFREIVHPDDYKKVSRTIVLPKYKGRKAGDDEAPKLINERREAPKLFNERREAPKLFNERRTDGRMTRNLEIRLAVNKKGSGSKKYRNFNIQFSIGEWDRFVTEKKKKYIGSVGMVSDVTVSKKLDLSFKNIFYNSHDAILLISGNDFVDCNESTVKLLNAKSKEDVLITHPSVLSPEKQPDGRESYEKANEMMDIAYDKGFHRFEWMHKKLTGEIFPVEVSLTAIEYNNQLMLHTLWKDLTEKKKTEEQLKKNRELEKMFLDSLPHPAMIINQKRVIVAANKVALEAGAKLHGYCWKEFGKTGYISREDKLRCQKGDAKGIKCTFCLADKAVNEHTTTNNPDLSAFGKVWDIYWKYIGKDESGDSLFLHYAIDITERKKVEIELEKITFDLGERVKELNCLYEISELVEKPGITLQKIFQGTVDLIPLSWQYPEITCARLILDEEKYMTADFSESQWKLESDVIANGKKHGTFQVYYIEEKPEIFEGPFQKEERDLLNIITERLGRIIERKLAENEIKNAKTYSENIISSLSDGLWILDLQGNTVDVSPSMLKISGYDSKEELIGKSPIDVTAESDREETERLIKETFEKGHSSGETSLIKKNGDKIGISVSTSLLKDADEKTIGLIGMIRDITKRKKSEEQIKLLSDAVADSINAMALTDLNGNNTYVNASYERMFGYPSKEAIGMKISQFVPEEELGKLTEEILPAIKNKGGYVGEIICRRKDKSKFPISFSTSLIKDVKGKPTAIMGSFIDIAERKKAEEQLTLFKQAVVGSTDGIGMLDTSGKAIYTNDALINMLGTVGDPLNHFVDENKWHNLFSTLQSGKPWSGEVEMYGKDRNVLNIRLNSYPITDKNNKIISFVGIHSNITELKRMEKVLNDREITLRNMYDSKLMGFLLWDADGEIIDSNDTFLKMLGYTREEFFSKNVFWQDIIPEEYVERDSLILSELAADKPVSPFEEEYIRKDGSLLPVLIGATVLPDPGIGGAAFVLDIAERKKLEGQLRQSEKMEAIGQLSGGIAHDFNNILAVILANAEASLKNTSKEDRTRKSLREIVSASQHAKKVVKQLLLFARKTEMEKRPVKINVLVRNALKLVRATMPSTIAIHTHISKRTGTVYADPTQINQILLNLCTNATHAMEETGGTIKINLSDITLDETSAIQYENLRPGQYVQLTVADTGHGIKAEHKNQLFEPYFTTKSVNKGTGLGLAVTHGIVKDLRGGIFVESGLTQGTTFKILFPQTSEKPVSIKRKTVSKGPLKLDKNVRILLVDDEESVLKSLQLILQIRGFHVEGRTDPSEALEQLRSDPKQFDLIITDMTMPGIRGDELAIEALKIRHDIPIILTTGYNDKIDEKRAKSIGIRKYLEKPFTEEEITQAIHEAMGG